MMNKNQNFIEDLYPTVYQILMEENYTIVQQAEWHIGLLTSE